MTPRDHGIQSDNETSNRADTRTAQVRILATTDIHMQLMGFDYVADQAGSTGGLCSLATLIRQARAEAKAQSQGCILLDNGDILQGNAMGDLLAKDMSDQPHPVAETLNALAYDAVGVGNHDLDYGLPYLKTIASQLNMPMVSTNLDLAKMSPLQNAALVTCAVPGSPQTGLNIGVLSVLPAQTAIWNRFVLQGISDVFRPESCLPKAVRLLRARGADIVVLLAHVGINDTPNGRKDRESALSMAQIPGIDAVITGHTHRRFPGADHPPQQGVDVDAGTLANRPAIMPGYAASDLAVLELSLERNNSDVWRVTDHKSTLRQNGPEVVTDPEIEALCRPAHQKTRNALASPVGSTASPLHNYFSLAVPTKTCALTAKAKARAILRLQKPAALKDLPVLATASAHTAGGRGGPRHYLHIGKGPVLRRHVAGLCPYANQVTAVRVTGADIKLWLEVSAQVFRMLSPGNPEQLLLNADVPAFNFDTIFGLTYAIDPTQPTGARICDMRYNGKPVLSTQLFLMATNEFRVAGGGGCIQPQPEKNILRSGLATKEAVTTLFRDPLAADLNDNPPWRFQTRQPVQAILETSPKAVPFLDEVAHLAPEPLGLTARGFERIRLTL